MIKQYRIEDGSNFKLSDFDPNETGDFKDKKDAEEATKDDLEKLRDYQEKFYVDRRFALLVVLQAMDTAGKDSTIDHVFSGINPTGCTVHSFKKPNETDLSHDFLWRVHQNTPPKGMIHIFNRSHYEEVLIVRVHDLVPKDVWKQRYGLINDFEKLLAAENTLIVKFFLHIDKDEQKKRLESRLEEKDKLWKFDVQDLKERERWDDYQEAYQDAIRKCSTPQAPWVVVPSNKKWYRNYVVARTLLKTFEKIDFKLPKPDFDPSKIVIH